MGSLPQLHASSAPPCSRPGFAYSQTASGFYMGSLAQLQATSAEQHAQGAYAMPQLANSNNSFASNPQATGQTVPMVQAGQRFEDMLCMKPAMHSSTPDVMMHGCLEAAQISGATHVASQNMVARVRHQIDLVAAIDGVAMPSGQSAAVPMQSSHSCVVGDANPLKAAADVTTLMIRNLPSDLTQQSLIDKLQEGGFGEACDFVYMPTDAGTKQNKGYAFVNLTSKSLAGVFIGAWHLSRRFGTVLSVSAAELQGFQANLNRWAASRKRQMQGPCLQPFIRQQGAARQQSEESTQKLVQSSHF
eukprot:TRINITY_DN2651_c0_g4_i1.p1 TRINITY_DN2651_c0_g4~~TRINITY_DN2651_c0_g4_i1.p1  ORF type:complete len:303 (+),score=66.64 TRINITY_DN2651_c0_g4_i1:872-1780(+)